MTADPRASASRVGWRAFFAAVLRGDIRPTSLYEFSAGTEIWRDFVGGGRQRPAYTDYLNLGYWRDRPATYREAGDALAAQLALFAGLPDPRGRRLAAVDVGFGFGEQDLLWARDFNLDLVGLNIVARQVREARERVHAAGLADRVRYLQASATAMPIASASADRVLALESAPHFDTRREFFAEAFRVLRPGGVLAAADVVSLRPLRPGLAPSALAHRAAIGAARRLLRAPAANVYGPDRYRELLEAAGFVDIAIRSIGADVFPGFYRLMRRPPRDLSPSVSVWRPVMAGGSRLLLLAYRRGWADYVLIRAVKPPASAPAGSDVTTGAARGAGLSATPHQVHADCCIVGAGPAGAMLALLLARQGLAVTLLEQHRDFERRFRGDTLHPSILQLLDDLGLVERLLQLPHTRFDRCILDTADGPLDVADLRRLKTRFPYVVLMPQARFLDFLTTEARRYPGFRLLLGACAEALIEEGGIVRGVRYRAPDGWREVRAPLTVGADGRYSRLRRLAGFTPIRTAPPIDVIWFQLPRQPDDPAGAFGWIGRGRTMGGLDRGEHWEVACGFPAGTYRRLRAAGLPALRQALTELAPSFAERLEHLRDWKQIAVLSVDADRLPRWYRPGLLLIGDAAHAMSPVAGVGISYAVQDALVAANVLAGPLLAGRPQLRDLAAVQRRRELPTRAAQALLALLQRWLIAEAPDRPALPKLPALLRLPLLRDLPAHLIAHGVAPVRFAPHLRR